MGVLEGSIAKYVGDLRWGAQIMGVPISRYRIARNQWFCLRALFFRCIVGVGSTRSEHIICRRMLGFRVLGLGLCRTGKGLC